MTFQGVGAVVAGFVSMALIVMLGSLLISKVSGIALEERTYLPVHLAADFLLGMIAAVAGGLMTATLAPAAPLSHAIALAALVLAMAVYCLVTVTDNGPPRWYQAVLSLASASVVTCLGWLMSQPL